jgi:VCBS repeat-containing protein
MRASPKAKKQRIALEPRMMLDGAMVMDAVGMATEQANMAQVDAQQDASSQTEPHADLALEPQAGPFSSSPAAPGQTAWVFIDGSLPGLSDLLAQVPADATVVLLDPARDGLAQVNEALAGQHDVRAIHLVTHGDQGAIMLGSTRLDLATAGDDHAAALATLGTHLAAGADILLYGCEVASSDVAIAGMEKLAFLLDADLAASDDATGAASLGGDWLLEKQSGAIETSTLNGGAWVGLLNTLSVNVGLNLNTPLAVPEDSTLAFTGSSLLQLTLTNMLSTSTSVELSVQHGSLSFAPLAGVAVTGGDGNQDTAVTLTGSVTAINRVLSSLTYNGDPDYNGSDTLRLAVKQSLLGILSISAPINIGLNITPVADIVADSASTLRDQPIAINVMANDNFERSSAAVGSTTQPAHGSVTLSGNVVTYTPAPGYTGSDSFTYTVNSGTTTETATVSINVVVPNTPPTVTVPVSASSGEDQPLLFSAANGTALTVTDPDGGTLTATLAVTHGTLTLASTAGLQFTTGDGTSDGTLVFSGTATAINGALDGLRFTPDADYNGSATLSLAAGDGQASRAASIPISLVAVADAVDDSVVTGVLTPVTLYPLANDRFEGAAAIASVGAAAHGTVLAGPGGSVIYTPDAGYRGSDSFIVTVSAGGVTETETVSVTVGTNQAPTLAAALGGISTQDKAIVAASVAAGFIDADLGDTLRFSATGLPAGLSIDAVTGLLTGRLDGHASQDGPYSVAITATDNGGLSATATLSLTVANPAPIAIAGVAVGQEDSNLRIEALLNASDADGDDLRVIAATALHGTVTIAPDGALSYTPDANYNGLDSITYTVRDADGASATGNITVTVAAVADLPSLRLPTIPVFAEDTPLIFASLLGTSIEIGDVDGQVLEIGLSVPGGLLTLEQHAGVNISQGDGVDDSLIRMSGTAANLQAALEQLQLLPGPDYNGPLRLTVSLGELGQTLGLAATLPIGIAAVADIVDDHVVAVAGQPVGFNVLLNDSFEHAGRTVTAFQTPGHGTLTLDGQGNAVYTPTAGFTGTDTFTYTVTSNGTTETATVTLTIEAAPNHAPTGTSLADIARDDGAVIALDLSARFADPDGDTLVFSASGLPAGLAIDTATGVITGTLGSSASSAMPGGVYTITVSASDGRSGLASQVFTLTVANVAPAAAADSATGSEDGVINGNVLANDSDADRDALTVDTVPVQGPEHGVLVLNGDGSFSYTPDTNYSGSDSFTYRVTDADGAVSSATVSLTITAVNDAPGAAPVADRDSTAGTTVTFDAAAAFADVDGDTLSYSSTGLPPGLSLDPATGQVTGTPTTPGSYSVTLSAADGNGGNVSTTFTWTVEAAPNNGPTTVGTLSTETANDAQSVSIATAGVFRDGDGDTLVFSASGLPAGLAIDTATGVITGTLGSSASSAMPGGVYTITVSASDGRSGLASQVFTLTVANVAPAAAADSATGSEDGVINGNVLANDSDADRDALTVDTVPVQGPEHGVLVLNGDGSFSYTPDTNYSGSDSFTYRVTDADGAVSSATVSLTITAVNDAPGAAPVADRDSTAGTTVTFDAAAAFADVDGDTLSYSSTGLPPGLSLDPATGQVTGTPTTPGSYSVTLSAADGNGGNVSTMFVWTVEPVSAAPTQPAPVEPAPATPAPVDPAPVQPTPVEPKPREPEPTEPVPAEPAPVEPGPVEPAPVEPVPTEPAPVNPVPVEPTPREPVPTEPIPVEPAPVAPVPVDPRPIEPAPVEPAPVEPVPTQPAPISPVPVEPTPREPVPTEPIPVEPAPVAPVPVDPRPIEPTPVAPAPVAPVPTQPAPVTPVPVEPTPRDPVPTQPAPIEPTPVDPVPVEQAPIEPIPVEPAPIDPVPVAPTPAEPAPVEPTPPGPVPTEPTPVPPEPEPAPGTTPTPPVDTEPVSAEPAPVPPVAGQPAPVAPAPGAPVSDEPMMQAPLLAAIGAQDNGPAEPADGAQYRAGAVDTVLLQAINAVQTLGMSADISVDRPLAEAVGAVQALGRPSQIDASDRPIGTIVGDLGADYRTPLQVDWMGNAQGADAPAATSTARDMGEPENATETPTTVATAEADLPIVQSPETAAAASVQQQLLDALQLRSREVEALRSALRQS